METSIMLIIVMLTNVTVGGLETAKPTTYFKRGFTMESCRTAAAELPARNVTLNGQTIIGTICTAASGTTGMEEFADFSIQDSVRTRREGRSL
jgi:hypothetical protein